MALFRSEIRNRFTHECRSVSIKASNAVELESHLRAKGWILETFTEVGTQGPSSPGRTPAAQPDSPSPSSMLSLQPQNNTAELPVIETGQTKKHYRRSTRQASSQLDRDALRTLVLTVIGLCFGAQLAYVTWLRVQSDSDRKQLIAMGARENAAEARILDTMIKTGQTKGSGAEWLAITKNERQLKETLRQGLSHRWKLHKTLRVGLTVLNIFFAFVLLLIVAAIHEGRGHNYWGFWIAGATATFWLWWFNEFYFEQWRLWS